MISNHIKPSKVDDIKYQEGGAVKDSTFLPLSYSAC